MANVGCLFTTGHYIIDQLECHIYNSMPSGSPYHISYIIYRIDNNYGINFTYSRRKLVVETFTECIGPSCNKRFFCLLQIANYRRS